MSAKFKTSTCISSETRENCGLNRSYPFGATPNVDSNKEGENFQVDSPGDYNGATSISSLNLVQQPQKCLILKPITSNSTSKTDLKYSLIRSFTPSRRTFSNVPMRSNNETETIAQKIPVSLPKIIVDVAKPKNNFNSSTNSILSAETDRSTVFPVKQFPPHVQNVIGGLMNSRNGNTSSYKPLVVETSQFQNKISQNNVNSNYEDHSFVKPAQNLPTWPANINWNNNNNLCQPIISDYLNNVQPMRANYPLNAQLCKSQNIVVGPSNSTWKGNPIGSVTTSGWLSNADTQKLSNLGTWSTNNVNNFGEYSNTYNWGNAVRLLGPTHGVTNSFHPNFTPSKPNKVVPTITGTKIIPNFNPNKTRPNYFSGYVNGQNAGGAGSNSTVVGSTDSRKNIISSPFNSGFVAEPSVVNNGFSSNSNIDQIQGTTDSKNNIFISPMSYNNAKIENKPNFTRNSTPNLKIEEGFDGKKIMSLAFDSMNDELNNMNQPTVSSSNDSANKDNIITVSENNVRYSEKPNIINNTTLYSKVFENIESGNILTTSTAYNRGGPMYKSTVINNNDIDFKVVENIDTKYNIITSSTTTSYDNNCESILPINSDEEELLNTPDCAFDDSFTLEVPNASRTDVFEDYNTSSIDSHQALGNNNSVIQATSTLKFNESLPFLEENGFLVKEENNNVQKNIGGSNISTSGLENAILPDYQEDLSFVFLEDEPKFSVGNLGSCEEKDEEFDLDSLIEKNEQFSIDVMKKGEIMIEKSDRKIDGDKSCDKIIKGKDFGKKIKNGKETTEGDFDALCSKMAGEDEEQVLLPCGLCEMMFQNKLSLKVHLRTHSKENDYVCEVCGRSFKQETTLKNHYLRSHTYDNKTHKCNVCEQSFDFWSMLKEHRETVHPSNDKHQCYICEKVFPNKTALKAHVQRHTDPRRYKCQYCDKVYKDRAGLNVHLVVHTQVSKFSCTLCDRKFGKKNLLTDHMKIFHLKQKDHTCHECNRAFSTKNTLKRHSWIHTGEKNYICEICGRPFRQKVALTVHMKVHNKPPKFQNAFGSSNGLINLCNNNNFVSQPVCNVFKFQNENVESKYNHLVLL